MQKIAKEFNDYLQNNIVPQEWIYRYLRPIEKIEIQNR